MGRFLFNRNPVKATLELLDAVYVSGDWATLQGFPLWHTGATQKGPSQSDGRSEMTLTRDLGDLSVREGSFGIGGSLMSMQNPLA